MRRASWMGLVLTLVVLGTPASALAQKRVALVIGNGTYTKVARLDNPKNDAAAMEAMFKAAAFTSVVRLNDLGVMAMRRALRDFSDTAQDADMAVVFYAGHGIEVAGVNYLIPIDAVLERDIDVQDEAISLDRINQVLEPVRRLRLIILDACRDNPFARSMRRTIATRSVRSGYGEIDERALPANTLVAYAQRAGFTAEDGVGSSNSPYTTALIKHLPTPGLDIELALRRVRDEVLRATKNKQEPFKYGSLGGAEIALIAKPTEAELPKKIEPTSPSPLGQAAAEWNTLRTKTDIAELEAFAKRHQGTYFADLARARIDELKKQQVAVAKPETEQKTKRPEAVEQKTALVETPAPKVLSPTPSSDAQPGQSTTPTPLVFQGHSDTVLCVAFSPDGKTVASGSTDTTVRFIDPLNANAKGAPISGHIGPVSAVRFSPDGEMLATAGSGGDERTVRLWNVGDRGAIGRLTGHLDSVTDVGFSPDGTMLATASADATIRLWSLSSRRQIASLSGHGGPVRAVTFSPDGKLLASAGADGTARLWDVERRASIANLKARDEVNAVAFSPDGKLLASGGRENTVRLWDVDNRRAKGAIDIVSTTSGWVRSLAFSPDGRALAAGSVDNKVRIWDAARGDLLVELTGHGNSVNGVAFRQGPGPELLLASAGDRTVRLWNLTGRLP
jgi:glucose/arabinose dehydrogenase